ncbi:MAG: cytochrome c biogenesis CcdA family protein [Halanaerobiaceae bacterium]
MSSDISIFIAFGAGLMSFTSPCILPLIPSYLTFLLGDYSEQKLQGNTLQILPAVLFTAGFSLVFILMGISASYIGKLLLKNQALLRKISGIIIIILGVHLTGLINLGLFNYTPGYKVPDDINKYLRAILLGIGLAFAWTPCIGPVLSTILVYAGSSGKAAEGAKLLAFYSLGMALPFILIALFFRRFISRLKKINKYLPRIKKISGMLIIILGVMIYFNYLNLLQ